MQICQALILLDLHDEIWDAELDLQEVRIGELPRLPFALDLQWRKDFDVVDLRLPLANSLFWFPFDLPVDGDPQDLPTAVEDCALEFGDTSNSPTDPRMCSEDVLRRKAEAKTTLCFICKYGWFWEVPITSWTTPVGGLRTH